MAPTHKVMDLDDLPLSEEDDDFSKAKDVKRARVMTQQERDRLEVEQYLRKQQQEERPAQPVDQGMKQELERLRQELQARTKEAEQMKAELSRVRQQVRAPTQGTLQDLVRQDVERSYVPNRSNGLLYHDVAEFVALRQQALYNRIELLAAASPSVASERLTTLQTRQLMDQDIETCLKIKKQAMEDKDEPPRRVQDGVLQLFKLLHRRQTAVLQGYKLAPLDSLFAQVPK